MEKGRIFEKVSTMVGVAGKFSFLNELDGRQFMWKILN